MAREKVPKVTARLNPNPGFEMKKVSPIQELRGSEPRASPVRRAQTPPPPACPTPHGFARGAQARPVAHPPPPPPKYTEMMMNIRI